jgi:glutaredoxin
LLQSNGIKFNLVDVASSESARQYAKRANNNGSTQGRIKEFPQIFVGGEYRGVNIIL